MTRQIDPLGRSVTYAYDTQWNKVTSVTRRDDNDSPHVWRFTYDPARGTMLTATNPANETTRFSYTPRGELASVTGPLDQTVAMTYSDAGDLASIVDPLGNETRLEHDGVGRQSGERSPLGSLTRWTYNGVDALTTRTDPLGLASQFDYDPAGRLAAVTNARGNRIESYTYDAHDRLEQRTDALGRSTAYEHDSAGRVAAVTDRRGLRTTYAYEGTSRLVSVERPEGLTRYSYDAIGRVVEISDLEGTLSFTYDAADRLTREIQATSGLRAEIAYEYDALDRRITRRVTGAPGEMTRYAYDPAGRLTSIEYRGEHTTFAYDAGGRIRTKTLPNGIRQELTYDDADRILSIVHANSNGVIIDTIAYEYDVNGRRVGRTTSRGGLSERTFAAVYDAADRMTVLTLTATGQVFDLEYDANGNLASQSDRGGASRTAYEWDSQNRLVRIAGEDGDAVFAYDPLGRRILRTVNGTPTYYIYDREQAIAAVSAGSASELVTTLRLDEVIARYSDDASRAYLTDAQQSVIAQVRADGSILNFYEYSPYGTAHRLADDEGNAIQYTARENDANGLYYYRARYYNPTTGRFISEDPAGLSAGMNRYQYVFGDPITLTDPTGRLPPVFWLIGIGVGIGTVGCVLSKECRENPRKVVPDFLGNFFSFPGLPNAGSAISYCLDADNARDLGTGGARLMKPGGYSINPIQDRRLRELEEDTRPNR